jgi:hypothetical protein
MPDEYVHSVVPSDDELAEEWLRESDDPDIRFVGATKSRADGEWQLTATAMCFVRKEPLESDLRQAMASALGEVPGVSGVWEEDREIWHVDGNPNGGDLTRAAAQVIDAFGDRLREHYNSL